MEEKAFAQKIIENLDFAAKVSADLQDKPKTLKQLLDHTEVTKKIVEDPVFFSALMCGDSWLVNAPDHQRLLRDQSRKQVTVCGRGWGKSLVLSRKNLWLLYTKPQVESLIISSTQRQSMIIFDYCISTIRAHPVLWEMIQRPGTTRTNIKLKPPLNSKLTALPCSQNKLRGPHPDYIFLDEASYIPSKMITSEIMPMLTKPGAGFIMSGTPLSFDHPFRKAYLDTTRYSVHHYSGESSPLVSKEQLAELKEMMTKEEWQREIEALWVEVNQSFFPLDLIAGCIDPTLDDQTQIDHYIEDLEHVPEQLNGRFFAGLDLGKQVDYSVLTVVQVKDKTVRLIHKRQFPLGTPYPQVVAYCVRANQVFNLTGIFVDRTGIGDAVVDELVEVGLKNVKGVFFTDVEKENILNYLKLLMEKGCLMIRAEDRELMVQLNEQQYEYVKPGTAQERLHMHFAHPRGRHDDQLFALALACYASKEVPPAPASGYVCLSDSDKENDDY